MHAVSLYTRRWGNKKKDALPFQNQYLAELLTPRVKDAEERQLLSPAVCA
jgi:hypothetical protein